MLVSLPDSGSLGVFVLAAVLLLVTPGPAVLYIVARSIHEGRRAGLVSVLGVHTGTLVHVAGAAAGLSALLAASATAFTAVKYLGAAYLIYLGVRRLCAAAAAAPDAAAGRSLRRAFVDGLIVNVLNPKTALWGTPAWSVRRRPGRTCLTRARRRGWAPAASRAGPRPGA